MGAANVAAAGSLAAAIVVLGDNCLLKTHSGAAPHLPFIASDADDYFDLVDDVSIHIENWLGWRPTGAARIGRLSVPPTLSSGTERIVNLLLCHVLEDAPFGIPLPADALLHPVGAVLRRAEQAPFDAVTAYVLLWLAHQGSAAAPAGRAFMVAAGQEGVRVFDVYWTDGVRFRDGPKQLGESAALRWCNEHAPEVLVQTSQGEFSAGRRRIDSLESYVPE